MNKYHAKKVTYDGITFDSTKEYRRYVDLKLLEKAKEITDLKVHFPIILFDKSEYGRTLYYIADFTYYDCDKNFVVEDVKGCKKGVAYQMFRLKKRIIAEKYGIEIQEM